MILATIHYTQSFLIQLIQSYWQNEIEFKGKIISAFGGLMTKMYSLISVYNEEVTKAKGVNKKLRHKEFFSVLFNKK